MRCSALSLTQSLFVGVALFLPETPPCIVHTGASCARNRTLRTRTGFDPCVSLIQERGTDQILPPIALSKNTSDPPDFPLFLGFRKRRPTGFCVLSFFGPFIAYPPRRMELAHLQAQNSSNMFHFDLYTYRPRL